MVTLADVAALAGVSEATVSRVMSSSRPVGHDVEVRVKRAASQLGYVGNSIARALRKSRTDTVGMVIPSILNPFFTALVDSMERALHAEGKQLFLCDSRQNPDVEAEHLKSLIQRQVDGIVVSACDQMASIPALQVAARSVPLVQMDRRVEVDNTDWIGVDDDDAMRLVLEELARTGAKSAAFITSAMTNSSTHLRLKGFRHHAARLGITVREPWILLGEYSISSGETATQQLLTGTVRPDAIVCANDLIAIGVLHACRQLDILVPTDIQVTGFDDIAFAAYVVPALTTLTQPVDLMATEALRLLQISSTTGVTRHPSTQISFAPSLIVRETTRSVP